MKLHGGGRGSGVIPKYIGGVGDEEEAREEIKADEDDEVGESGARTLIRMQDPILPSRQEVEDHEKTHLPYRSWCTHCVRGNGT